MKADFSEGWRTMKPVLASRVHVVIAGSLDFMSEVVKTVGPGKYLLRIKKKTLSNNRSVLYTDDSTLVANFSNKIRFSYTNQ